MATPDVLSIYVLRRPRAALSRLAICCVLVIAQPVVVAADQPPANAEPSAPQERSQNVYMAGFSVRLAGPAVGDFLAAGCPVTVDQSVGKDAIVAGCDVLVKGPIGDDLRAVGGQVIVDGKVGGETIVAGGRVTLTSGSDVAGRAWLSGGRVSVDGKVGRDLKVYAGKVSIQGEVGGDARIVAEEIEVLPGAEIKGALTYTSRDEIKIDSDAHIIGKITREPTPRGWRREDRREPRTHRFAPIRLLGMIAAGSLFILLFPGFTRAAPANVGSAPWQSLGLGTAVLFAGPPLVIVLLITLIGIPIALALLACYAILLLIGYLTTATFIGDGLARRLRKGAELTTGWRIGALAAALILLALARLIPLAGGLITLLALLFGIGALVLQLVRHYRGVAQNR